MRAWLDAHKPAAPVRTHLLLAALMWSVVGAALLLVGAHWLLASGGARVWLFLTAAIGLGLLKGRFVLEHAAGRIIARIRVRGDGHCLGGFLSVWTWALVAGMAIAGRVLRSGFLPHAVVGFVYVVVGAALLWACRRFWHAWAEERTRSA